MHLCPRDSELMQTKWLVVFSLLLFICIPLYAMDDKTRVAFYYGEHPPMDELHAFNIVVVNAGNHISPKDFNKPNSQLYAYISVGELDKGVPYEKQANPSWIKGQNSAWNSHVMDLANPGWRDFLFAKLVEPLWQQGYRGFFLDTLDSYELLKLSPEQKKLQEAGIVDFIKKIKAAHPEASIILNRGFPVINAVHQDISAVAAESLFAGWDPSKKIYAPVAESERQSLLAALNSIHQQYKLPIIVIDYVPIVDRAQARDVAKKIASLGFIPWVSVPHLDALGVGLVEVVPRKVLLLYDSLSKKKAKGATSYSVYDATAFVLQFMGYIPVLHKVDESLPKGNLNGIYAGVITWFDQAVVNEPQLLEAWLTTQVQNHLPILFMENFGLDDKSALLKRLGVEKRTLKESVRSVSLAYKEPELGYEIFPKPIETNFIPLRVSDGHILLTLQDEKKNKDDVIGITPWGGFALQGYNVVNLPGGEARWVMNPFLFLRQSLRLGDIPIPDITTENGRRILTVHIDGDAFISRVPWRKDTYAGELLLSEILNRYKLPTSVSVIQREFEIIGQFPEIYKRLVATAQRIFALPWVEIATHTYSHPLEWKNLEDGVVYTKQLSYPDPNYKFSYEKEIVGSQQFINDKLAPPNKKVVAVFWSGDANIQEKPLAIAYAAGLKNINGMAKIYTNKNPSITNLGPFGGYVGQYFQIYAPIPNEFEYTNNWDKPWYTFDQVIDTFTLTEKPIRYKPMSIYYHFYSAVEQASLRALVRVYDWAMKQYVTPLFISEYIDRVMDFNHTVMAKDLNSESRWLITNNHSLREFRWPSALGNPDFSTSQNIAGFTTTNSDHYIHLGHEPESWLSISSAKPVQPYLIDANGLLLVWKRVSDHDIHFILKAYVPLQFKLANMEKCQLTMNHQLIQPSVIDNSYAIQGVNSATFEIHCA